MSRRYRLTPCPECGHPRRGDTCHTCHWQKRIPPTRRTNTHTERQRRTNAIQQHRETYGNWCPGWDTPPHPATDLTADHITPIANGGHPYGPLQVMCTSCNGRKGANPHPPPH
jgi:5-methylcytosine-specific restriction protein A